MDSHNNSANETFGVEEQGIVNPGKVHRNLSTPELYEEIIQRKEGHISRHGVLVMLTGEHTGRSAKDKFIVKEPSSEDKIWWGKVNASIGSDKFDQLHRRLCGFLEGKDIFIQDCYAGADPEFQIPIRIITHKAWHSLFSRHMFIRAKNAERLSSHKPEFVVVQASDFLAEPEKDGTRSGTFIMVNFAKRLVIIGGSSYAGEIKKSIFTIMNYLLPQKSVLSMHCSANVGPAGDTALFFGLLGTGKTTLSADPERRLIGDDEHGWSDDGVFNFEGGCYAKVIRLSQEAEPEIFETTRTFGSILENVVLDMDTREIDLDDDVYTENTRCAYPIDQIPNIVPEGRSGHPKNIVFLTADAFGVMPPVAKLTRDQAIYHFLSGYTAKLAGTEKGVTEPSATFSTCFGAPFMSLHPSVYAKLLGEKIDKYNVNCYLINTGWTGGVYGVGSRIRIQDTRAIVRSALNGSLAEISSEPDEIFGLNIPKECPNVSSEILNPQNTWKDKSEYIAKAKELAAKFESNFKYFEPYVSDAVKNTAIKV